MDLATRRSLGAYYTSEDTAEWMAGELLTESSVSILEPSAGDGAFVDAVKMVARLREQKVKVTAVEINEKAVELLQSRKGVKVVHQDFHLFEDGLYDAIIGNPPFVRFRHLDSRSADIAAKSCSKIIGRDLDVSGSIWMSIVLHSIERLRINGRIAYVLPSDALYVRYARPFWKHLASRFGELRIVRCNERLFPEILQDVVLLFANGAGKSTNSVVCDDYESFSDLKKRNLSATSKVLIEDILSGSKPFMKALLSPAEREWLRDLHGETIEAKEVVKFNIGYVSGHKSFFHPSDEVVRSFRLPERSIKKSVVTGRKMNRAALSISEVESATENLWLPDPQRLTAGELRYIAWGEQQSIHLGHKASRRSPWYLVPGVMKPDFFVTVFGDLPRLIINDAELPASNSILTGKFIKAEKPLYFALSWYTSVTRLGIELSVHSLGGGVLVLVPREADAIRMPPVYHGKVPASLLNRLEKCLRVNNLEGAYAIGDEWLIRNGWNSLDLEKSREIAQRLRLRRITKS